MAAARRGLGGHCRLGERHPPHVRPRPRAPPAAVSADDAGSSGAAQLASQARPQSDFEIHVFLWAIVTVIVGLAMWSSRSLLASAGGVLVLSVAAERAQGILTQTRDLHAADLVANFVGVSAGLGLVSGLAILLGWQDEPHQLPSG